MKSDAHTTTIFTIIALMLAVTALRPLVVPDTVANAQASFAGLQVSRAGTAAPSTVFSIPRPVTCLSITSSTNRRITSELPSWVFL